jgi:hypothetical protein
MTTNTRNCPTSTHDLDRRIPPSERRRRRPRLIAPRRDKRLLSPSSLLAAAAILGLAAATAPRPQPPAPEAVLRPAELARWWDAEHLSPPQPPRFRHRHLQARLRALQAAAPDLFRLEQIGRSVEGRALYQLAFGRGPVRVLLWSQMHGDEPTATAALLDLYEYVRRHRRDPAVVRLLERLSVHTVPMLNPDGAERFERRNAQGLDINRDALLLQTPEGRALKALGDRLEPTVAFNLHDQNWRTSVGRPPQPAAVSLLAVASDEARRDHPGRILAKKIAALIRDALEPFAAGRIGRYDDTFEPRAFGETFARQGTSVVLIETGVWSVEGSDAPLVRLNFIALLAALDALASGRVQEADPSRYETLPDNEGRLLYRRISGATVLAGPGVPPFTGDVGIVATRRVVVLGRGREGRGPAAAPRAGPPGGDPLAGAVRRAGPVGAQGAAPTPASPDTRVVRIVERIEDLGDLRVYGALEEIDGRGLTVVAAAGPLAQRRRVGEVVRLPTRPPGRIVPGAPANLLLLRPLGDGGYRVERIFTAETTAK